MTQNINRGLRIGSENHNMTIDSKGQIKYMGDATMWEDIQTSLIGRRLYSSAGTVDYDYGEQAIVFQPSGDITDNNDVVSWSIQYPHAAKVNGSFNVHIHWEQTSSDAVEFTLRYRIQKNGDAKETTWTEVVVDTSAANAFSYTSGTLNQITPLASVDMTGAGLSAVVQFRLTRSDGGSPASILATFVDAHYEKDSDGSSEEYIK